MEAMHRRLPRRERYPPPPRQLALRVAEEAGVKEHFDEVFQYVLRTRVRK
jgi:hypothetical protein